MHSLYFSQVSVHAHYNKKKKKKNTECVFFLKQILFFILDVFFLVPKLLKISRRMVLEWLKLS